MRVPDSALLACTGIGGAAAAVATNPCAALASATQDYPAFVLVAGLLLIGLVADEEGLFAVAGDRLARVAPAGMALFCGAALIVGVVTATLNLDTSVAFMTPVLVYAARSRGGRAAEAPLLYGCLLLSNAGSQLLPGSNLTNLIVLGHLHLAGSRFLARMWLPTLAALVVTALVVAIIERRSVHGCRKPPPRAGHASRLAAGLLVNARARGRRTRNHPGAGYAGAGDSGPRGWPGHGRRSCRARPGKGDRRDWRARPAATDRALRSRRRSRHSWPGLVGTGGVARAPGLRRDGRAGHRGVGPGQQPARRVLAGRTHAQAPFRPAGGFESAA